MKPAVRRRSILLANIGTSPGVLTNTVWALAHQKKTAELCITHEFRYN